MNKADTEAQTGKENVSASNEVVADGSTNACEEGLQSEHCASAGESLSPENDHNCAESDASDDVDEAQSLPLQSSEGEAESAQKSEASDSAEKGLDEEESTDQKPEKPETAAKPASSPYSIPCPANGDLVIFVPNVDEYVANSGRECSVRGGQNGVRFAVLNGDNDEFYFVMTTPDPQRSISLKLESNRPGFDSIFIWNATDEQGAPWTVCTHLPVSGRCPIPESCQTFIHPAEFEASLGDSLVQAYSLSEITTIRKWREEQAYAYPSVLINIIKDVARTVELIFLHGHALVRISPDTIVIDEHDVHFLGVMALDMPWNERCALAHNQPEYAAVPPECFGFIRKRLTEHQAVYAVGAIAYFLVSGVNVPTCEALGYDVALMPRAFNPEFPMGWDEIIHKALSPNPENRYSSLQQFTQELEQALHEMYARRDFRGEVAYDIAVDTHIGVTKRLRCPVNQDAVFTRSTGDRKRSLVVVADGVSTSTYGSGDIASHIVIDVAQKAWDERINAADILDPAAEISKILEDSNEVICQYIRDRFADKNPMASECMGTTALVAIVENGILTLGAIGDSRAYLIRKDTMSCITRDHNLFTIGIINGLPVEMCAAHPHAGSLVQCLGYYEDSEDFDGLAFDIYSLHLIPGDSVMLTTDGILDYVATDIAESENQIAEIVRNAQNATIACLQLIIQANLGGGGDNCGVGIIQVSEV